jgi:hypothetical protein
MNVGGGEGTSPARAHKACKAQATMAPVVEWGYVASVCCGVRQGEGLRSWVCSCIEHDRRWGSECGWPPTEAPRTLENLHRAGKGVDAVAMWACVDKACHVRVCGRPAWVECYFVRQIEERSVLPQESAIEEPHVLLARH